MRPKIEKAELLQKRGFIELSRSSEAMERARASKLVRSTGAVGGVRSRTTTSGCVGTRGSAAADEGRSVSSARDERSAARGRRQQASGGTGGAADPRATELASREQLRGVSKSERALARARVRNTKCYETSGRKRDASETSCKSQLV